MLNGQYRPTVLVARLDSVGDVLLSGPAVRAVAAAGHRVTYLCSPRGAPAASLLPGVDNVIEADAPWIAADPQPVTRRSMLALVDLIAAAGADRAIVFTSFHQSPLPLALLMRMAGVPTVAAISVDYPGSLLDVRHRVSDDLHEVQRALSLVAVLGYHPPDGDDARLRVQPVPVPAGLPERYVAVHPGASVPARSWSPRRMRQLAALLTGAGREVVVTGGSQETALTAAVCEAAADGSALDLGGRTDLRTLAGVFAGADVVVTANTGPAHLAASVGRPVVSIYAPTVPAARWRPWMVPHRLLGNQEIGCAGCRARTCPVPGHPCVETVTAADALNAVDALAPTAAGVAI